MDAALLEKIFKALLWVVGLFGGMPALENLLENFVMDKMPQWAKPYVVPVISAVFAVIAGVQGGLSWPAAIAAALTLWGGTTAVHNSPTLTSADWALPAPPATADGVPGAPTPK